MASEVSAVAKTSRLSRFWHWLLPDDVVPLGKGPVSAERTGMLRSAQDYVSLADGLLDSSDDIPVAPVLTLYREAIFLLAAETWADKRALVVRFETDPESALDESKQADPLLAGIKHLVAMHALVVTGGRATPEQRDLAHVTRSTVHRVLEAIVPTPPHRNLLRRFSRLIGALLLLGLCVAGLVFAVHRLLQPTDLAAGKVWHTSSQLGAAYTAKILFHTNEEMNPWFEIDLGASKSIRALQVINRREANQDRAVPLVAEVSEDHSRWREVARQESSFQIWEPSFAATKARYVRLRVPRITMFHLEAVKVF